MEKNNTNNIQKLTDVKTRCPIFVPKADNAQSAAHNYCY